MKRLTTHITKELQREKHCAVYEADLSRVWPGPTLNRESKIRQFAENNGWELRFYKEGLCAICDKSPRDAKPGKE